jgi:hypothetical protein
VNRAYPRLAALKLLALSLLQPAAGQPVAPPAAPANHSRDTHEVPGIHQSRLHHAASLSSGLVALPVIDGHDPQFVRLSAAGEPFQGNVVSIAQDRSGFLWFGTSEGLYRYDGYNLKPYRREPGNPNSLSDDTSWWFTGTAQAFSGSALASKDSIGWTRRRTPSLITAMTPAIARLG